jgi:hypothetical protein
MKAMVILFFGSGEQTARKTSHCLLCDHFAKTIATWNQFAFQPSDSPAPVVLRT